MKTRIFLSVQFIILILLISFGCDKKSPTRIIETNSDQIIPLTIGNSWIRKLSYYDLKGDFTHSYEVTETVIKDTLMDNIKWYATSNNPQCWLTIKHDGCWYRILIGSLSEGLRYKYPCSVGDVIDEFNLEVKSVNSKIEVTAGKFNCIYYQQGKSELYFCPGIGSIKEIHYGKSGICKVELIEYDLL